MVKIGMKLVISFYTYMDANPSLTESVLEMYNCIKRIIFPLTESVLEKYNCIKRILFSLIDRFVYKYSRTKLDAKINQKI